MLTDHLCKDTLQERLHDGGGVGKDGLDDLGLLPHDYADLVKERVKVWFRFGSGRVGIGQGFPSVACRQRLRNLGGRQEALHGGVHDAAGVLYPIL
jgi:hypothetical protein